METAAERLRRAREALGIAGPREAARRFRWNEETYKSHENGIRGIKPQIAVKYGRAFGVAPGWILTGEGRGPSATAHLGRVPELPADTGEALESYEPVHRIEVPVGAGGGGFSEEDMLGPPEYLPPSLIRGQLRGRADDFLLLDIEGQSMEPALLSGDRVIVDRRKTNPSQGGLFCLWDGYGLVAKSVERVAHSDPPKLRVMSKNVEFSSYEILAEQAVIIGRIVWLARRL